MTQSALTPNSNLFDLIGPAADGIDFQIKFQKAKMISKGDPNQRWVKAILSNGEECFLFPDDTNTVKVKNYNIGTVFNVESRRPCRNPGVTKWTTNALHISLQVEQLKQLEKHQPESDQLNPVDSISEAESTASDLLANVSSGSKAQKVRVAIAERHCRFIDYTAEKLGIDCGYKTRSKALEVILDRLLATDFPHVLRMDHRAD
jgi:hypothetical protein